MKWLGWALAAFFAALSGVLLVAEPTKPQPMAILVGPEDAVIFYCDKPLAPLAPDHVTKVTKEIQ